MKKQHLILISSILLIGLFISNSVWAQYWSPSGNDIYNTNTGNVGIGTSTPSGKLHVYNATGDATIWLESPYSGSADRTIGAMVLKNSATGDLVFSGLRTWSGGQREYIQSGYDGSTDTWSEFQYFNFSSKKFIVRAGINQYEFDNSGDVLFRNTGGIGIGVTTIGQGIKLAVNGKINCKEVEVTLDGWVDHVFKKDYKLRPLDEVESFIGQNNHLPDVPGESEILKNGSNLGQMDAILLQKIEELTLYVIQLKKENELLTKKINEIK